MSWHFCFGYFLAFNIIFITIFPLTLQDQLLEGTEDFANEVFRDIISTDNLTNVAISPFFMERDLSLMMFACRNSTQRELKKVLQLSNVDPSTVIKFFEKYPAGLDWNGKFFYDRKLRLRRSFAKTVDGFYLEKPEEFSNEKLAAFEKFVKKRIDRILQSNDETLLGTKNFNLKQHSIIAINVASFKGQWEKPFPKAQTRIKEFYNWGKHFTQVMTMYNVQRVGYVDLPAIKAKAVNLPFKNLKAQLLLLLPSNEESDKTWANDIDLSDILERMSFENVAISLPLFQVNYGVSSETSMENLGLDRLFSSNADLSGAFEKSAHYKYPFFYHRTYLNFNELGCSLTAGDQRHIESADNHKTLTPEKFFIAERPFVFILHEDGLIRISGRVVALGVPANAVPPKEAPKKSRPQESSEGD